MNDHSTKHLTTRAREIVESAPGGQGREALVNHVQLALVRVYNEAAIDGAARARAHMLREQLAILQGIAQDANGRIRTIERELEAIADRGLVK